MLSTAFNRTRRVGASALSVLLPALLINAAFPISAAHARPVNRGMEPTHQPTVNRTDFVFDINADAGTLTSGERTRLINWFDAVRLGFGDRVAIAASDYDNRAITEGVADAVAGYGLLLSENAPVSAGEAQPGSVRIVVSRSTATVEDCPAWRDKSEADLTAGLSDNYGCAMARNLAAMVADPQDLVDGRTTNSLRTWTASRAIQTYREKQPTGSGALQTSGN